MLAARVCVMCCSCQNEELRVMQVVRRWPFLNVETNVARVEKLSCCWDTDPRAFDIIQRFFFWRDWIRQPMATELTIEQEHLLKRELLRLQLSKESEALDNMVNIDQLGFPFLLPNGKTSSGSDYPLCSYVLHNFIVGFPLIKKADMKFWQQTCQPFIQGLASKDISSSADRDEATKRRRIGRILKRLIMLFFVAGLGTNREKPKVKTAKEFPKPAAIEDDVNKKIENVDISEPDKGIPLNMETELPYVGPYGAVLGVREIITTSYIRNKTQSEYIIECFFDRGSKPAYVARKWSDFVELQKKISFSFPGKKMPVLPHKTLQNTKMTFKGREWELLREPQRVTLRNYIHKLCHIPRVARSDIFLDFLFKDRIDLTFEEREDIEARLALDRQRLDDKHKFREIVKEREVRLHDYIGQIKEQILHDDALPKIFMEIKTYKRVEDMSPLVQKFVEWCLVQFAEFLYDIFVASDSSPEMFSQVKRLHNLMPYTTMRGILKLSNPALIMKKMTDLFMATPFGNKSIIQQMFIRILNDDMQNQEKLIADLEGTIEHKDLIAALEEYIKEDHYSRIALQQRAADDQVDIVMEIIRTYCSRERAKEVALWHKEWQDIVKDSQRSEDEEPAVVSFSRLKDLLKLKIRARDKDLLRDFWGDPQTIKFIREIVNLTYDVFIEVFRYANVSESLGDFQKFMDDFVSYVDYATRKAVLDSNQVVDNLLELLQRHQNSIFKFVNRVYSRDTGFFIDLIEWLTLFVSFVQLRKEEKNRLDLLSLVESSKVASSEKVQEELQALEAWLQKRKETAEASITPTSKSDDFPTAANNFDISDVGLSWEDVNYGLAEVDRDDVEEFLPDHRIDLTNDQVTLERMRREKLASLEARKAHLSQRPEMTETAKLLPSFEKMLCNTLVHAKVEKFDLSTLKNGFTPLGLRSSAASTKSSSSSSSKLSRFIERKHQKS